jgi:hypothetical protein
MNHHPPFAGGITAGGALAGVELTLANAGGLGTGSLKVNGSSSSSVVGSNGEPASIGTAATRFPQRVRATMVPSVMRVSPGCSETFLLVQ